MFEVFLIILVNKHNNIKGSHHIKAFRHLETSKDLQKVNFVVVSFDKIDNTADKVNRRKYELNSIIYLKCLRFFLNLMNLLIIHAFNSLECKL